jgi:hypothetical protein
VTFARLILLISLLAVTACTRHPSSTASLLPPARPSAEEMRVVMINERKDEVLRQLAMCESGGNGDSAVPVIGGRGAYLGRFQFTPRTVISYVQQMDGRSLSWGEATALAHDYSQAAALAKWVIFERDGISNWPACSRKLGLVKQIAEIKSL